MRWEDQVPGDTILKDGRLWRDISWEERLSEVWSIPSLPMLLNGSQKLSLELEYKEFHGHAYPGLISVRMRTSKR